MVLSMQYVRTMQAAQPSARICFLLSQLGSHAGALFAEQTARLGLTPSQAGVIRLIGRTPGVSQKELAERLGTAQSRVVALLDGLESAGLSTRTRRSGDRRVQEVRLTEEGQAVLRRLRSAAEAQEAALTAGLEDAQRSQLSELLQHLVELR